MLPKVARTRTQSSSRPVRCSKPTPKPKKSSIIFRSTILSQSLTSSTLCWQDQLSVTVREACSATRSDAAPARATRHAHGQHPLLARQPTGFLCDLISRLVAGRAFLKRSLAGDAKRRVSGVKTTVKGLSGAAWGLAELRAAVEDMAAACRQPRVAQCLAALSEKLISKKIAAMLASDAWASHLTARACSGGPSFAHKQRLRHLAMALPQLPRMTVSLCTRSKHHSRPHSRLFCTKTQRKPLQTRSRTYLNVFVYY